MGLRSPTLPDEAGTGQWSAGDAFQNVQSNSSYWTSTTYMSNENKNWTVSFGDAAAFIADKITDSCYCWPVRGGN